VSCAIRDRSRMDTKPNLTTNKSYSAVYVLFGESEPHLLVQTPDCCCVSSRVLEGKHGAVPRASGQRGSSHGSRRSGPKSQHEHLAVFAICWSKPIPRSVRTMAVVEGGEVWKAGILFLERGADQWSLNLQGTVGPSTMRDIGDVQQDKQREGMTILAFCLKCSCAHAS
jgi:hypothetical protein